MAFGGFSRQGSGAPMAEINMVPLIDVMLVLLVIFIVTAPLLTHSVKIDLPRAVSAPNATLPEHIELAIDGARRAYWNGEATSDDALPARFAAEVARNPDIELHLRADAATPYEAIARVMSEAARAGIVRIGFVTDPRR
jgi:biopolymer transport protein ExbD